MAAKRKSDVSVPAEESDQLLIRPLGAGQEVGRSCIILEFKGRKIMLTQAQTGKFNIHVHVEYEWHLQNEDLDESEDEMEDKPIPNRREERPRSCFVSGSVTGQPNLAALNSLSFENQLLLKINRNVCILKNGCALGKQVAYSGK